MWFTAMQFFPSWFLPLDSEFIGSVDTVLFEFGKLFCFIYLSNFNPFSFRESI